MNDDVVISVNCVSKEYKLYENKLSRLKEAISFSKKCYHKEFLALKNVSFDIKKGETIGLIGKNGSGKSTLLKILSGIIKPTTGNIKINGKVSALLELGAGFNPEYTGLENIYLSGAILGFSKKEIDAKLDQIINFADIGDFIYHPVKLYSSGMFVRLAYAFQACIDPEILIVDEALAVGDTAFALKCMNHMKKLVEKGVTVILVTHDVQAIRSFCSRVIWLQNGEVKNIGNPNEVTSLYVKSLFLDEKNEITSVKGTSKVPVIDEQKKDWSKLIRWGNSKILIQDFSIKNQNNEVTDVLEWGEKIKISFIAEILSEDIDPESIGYAFSFRNKHGLDLIVSTTFDEGYKFQNVQKGTKTIVEFELENILTPGDYSLVLSAEDRSGANPQYFDFIENAVIFKVLGNKRFFSLVQPKITQEVQVVIDY
jgi:ABC-type polysaccharide/polyol phosphate transport system ATPase subunit